MSEDNADNVLLDTRLAGQLRRYHTWPVIGQQTVAEHSWNILRIYFSVADKIDSNLIFHIVFHDIGEQAIGDAPFPIKRDNPELKKHMDFLEQKSYHEQLEYWKAFRQTLLTDADRTLFKQIELIEMAEFGMDQVCLGNNHGFIVAQRCLRAVYNQKPCLRLVQYVIIRLKLFFKQCPTVFVYEMDEEWWYPAKWENLYGSKQETNRGPTLQNPV